MLGLGEELGRAGKVAAAGWLTDRAMSLKARSRLPAPLRAWSPCVPCSPQGSSAGRQSEGRTVPARGPPPGCLPLGGTSPEATAGVNRARRGGESSLL